MAKSYAITFDCDCGHTIENHTLDLTPGEDIKIDIQHLSQETFDCDKCGAEYGIGDIDVHCFKEGDEQDSEEEED